MPVFRVPATHTWGGAGSPGVNVWSVRTTEASVVVDELDAACSALQDFYQNISTVLAPTVQVAIGQDIVERDSLEDQSRPVLNAAATGTGSPAPYVLQVCIGWRTSLRARRGMGRTFVGPLQSGAIEGNGSVDTPDLTTIQTAAQALLNASDSATGWAVGVWGLQSPGVYDAQGRLVPGQPHVHRDFTAFKVRDQFAVLRSRRD